MVVLDLVPTGGRSSAFCAVGVCIGDLLAIQFLPKSSAYAQEDEGCVWVTLRHSQIDVQLRLILAAMIAGALRQANVDGDVVYDRSTVYVTLPLATSITECALAQRLVLTSASFRAELGMTRLDVSCEVCAVHFGEHGLTTFAPIETYGPCALGIAAVAELS